MDMKPSWHWTNQSNAEEIKEKLKKTLRHDNWKGKKRDDEIIKKLNKGKEKWIKDHPDEYKKVFAQTTFKKGDVRVLGENNTNWKGDKVGYHALHMWIVRNYGKPMECEQCGTERNIEWANKSQQYLRERDDWLQLCKSCHKKYDMKINNRTIWNKGLKRDVWQS